MAQTSPPKPVAALRQLLERTQTSRLAGPSALPFGIDRIDEWLPGGGLALGAVHEICEQGTDGARASLASLFAASILARRPGTVIWCLHSRDLFAPALARVGLHPDRVIYCETWKDAEVLPAMEESLRHGGLAGVVGELVKLPLTPSRRLQLAAEATGVMALALRRSGSKLDEHNASFSRWRIAPAPSGPMIDFDMGRAFWQLDLLRRIPQPAVVRCHPQRPYQCVVPSFEGLHGEPFIYKSPHHPDYQNDRHKKFAHVVECDGATYHRSATARDRDRLREMVLTDLGWRIRRIWSTEWWLDASSALQKIHERLETDLTADRSARAELISNPEPDQIHREDDAPASSADDERGAVIAFELPSPRSPPAGEELPMLGNDQPASASEGMPSDEPVKLYARGPLAIEDKPEPAPRYSKADLTDLTSPYRDRFYELDYRSQLRTLVEHVISVEGPIYFDVLVHRLARAHGILRSGETVQKVVRGALGRDRFALTREGERQVVWPSAEEKDIFAYRSGDDRDHGDIPLGELAGLASLLAKQGSEDEKILRAMQLHFKLGRLAASTRERFEEAIVIFRQSTLAVPVNPLALGLSPRLEEKP